MNARAKELAKRAVKQRKRLNRERTQKMILDEKKKLNPNGWGIMPQKPIKEK